MEWKWGIIQKLVWESQWEISQPKWNQQNHSGSLPRLFSAYCMTLWHIILSKHFKYVCHFKCKIYRQYLPIYGSKAFTASSSFCILIFAINQKHFTLAYNTFYMVIQHFHFVIKTYPLSYKHFLCHTTFYTRLPLCYTYILIFHTPHFAYN